MQVPKIGDDVLAFRAWGPDDVAAVHRMVQDPQIPRFLSIPPNHTVEGVARWIGSRDEAMASGTDISLAITDAATGELLGSISLELSADDPAIGEIGYWIAAPARGSGVATRAVALLTEWAFRELPLARLEITTHEDNLASQRVAENNGFVREGVLRAWREQHGERIDLVMFSRLKTD